ncbi:MAG: signal peptidase I [bacterium]
MFGKKPENNDIKKQSIIFSESKLSRQPIKDLRSIVYEHAETAVIVIFLAILIKIAFLGSYMITDKNMGNTLLPGDRIFTNNFIYGIKIPFTRIRIPGFVKIKEKQLLVFNNPENSSRTTLLRCAAGPGQKIEIINKQLYVDSVPFLFPPGYAQMDSISIESRYLPRDNLSEIVIPRAGDTIKLRYLEPLQFGYLHSVIRQENPDWRIKTAAKLKLDNITRLYYDFSDYTGADELTHPLDKDRIPLTGIVENCHWIELNNIIQFIQSRLNNKKVCFDLYFIINGDTLKNYIIKNPCYFVMGDNWDHARDSRYWGFLSRCSIISRPIMIFWSRDLNRERGFVSSIRWRRLARFL